MVNVHKKGSPRAVYLSVSTTFEKCNSLILMFLIYNFPAIKAIGLGISTTPFGKVARVSQSLISPPFFINQKPLFREGQLK